MKLYIKNMVCSRCRMIVKAEMEKLNLDPLSVELGEVELASELTAVQKQQVAAALQHFGFELIDDRKSRVIEKIKSLIIDLVQVKNNALRTNLSDYLSQQLMKEYSTLSSLFSEVENVTIEQYFISQKIEKVKELLMYDELTLSEIAFMLHYSSVAHLSNQFKKATGFSPSYFKRLKHKKRRQIEDL